jgi:hypothetical protein
MIKLVETTEEVHFVLVHSNEAGWGIFGGHGTKGQTAHCGWPNLDGSEDTWTVVEIQSISSSSVK